MIFLSTALLSLLIALVQCQNQSSIEQKRLINGTIPKINFNWGIDAVLFNTKTLIPICQIQNVSLYASDYPAKIINLRYPLILTIAPVGQVPFIALVPSVDNSSSFRIRSGLKFGQEFLLSLSDSIGNYGGLADGFIMSNGTSGSRDCAPLPILPELSFTTESINPTEIDVTVTGGMPPYTISAFSPNVIGAIVNTTFTSDDIETIGNLAKMRVVAQSVSNGIYYLSVSDKNGRSSILSKSYTGSALTVVIPIDSPINSSINITAIVVGAVLGAIIILLSFILFWLYRNKRNSAGSRIIDNLDEEVEDKSSYQIPPSSYNRPSLIISTVTENTARSTPSSSNTSPISPIASTITRNFSLTPESLRTTIQTNSTGSSRVRVPIPRIELMDEPDDEDGITSPLANPSEFQRR